MRNIRATFISTSRACRHRQNRPAEALVAAPFVTTALKKFWLLSSHPIRELRVHEPESACICWSILSMHAGPWQIFFFKKRWEQCYFIEVQVGLFYLLFWKLPVRSINVCFQFSVNFLDSSHSHHPGQMARCYLSSDPGMSKVRPAGQIQPVIQFCLAHGLI